MGRQIVQTTKKKYVLHCARNIQIADIVFTIFVKSNNVLVSRKSHNIVSFLLDSDVEEANNASAVDPYDDENFNIKL